KIGLRMYHGIVQPVEAFKQPDTGAAVNGRDVESYDGNISVPEIDQLVGQRLLVEVFVPGRSPAFLFPGVRVEPIISMHTASGKYTVYSLTSQATEDASVGHVMHAGNGITAVIAGCAMNGLLHTALLKRGSS